MPTYSYRCTECGEAFDIQQAFTDDSLTVCPNCGGKLRKVFNAVGVSFTGSGFYRNDSRAPVPAEGGSGSGSSSSDSSSSPAPATPKSDSAPSTSSPAPAAAAPATTKKKE
ncbi:MAG: FmdB family transcriptional regulator [Actinomycetota bacterium]|nr:FmdB family transcriptional regulator [Actinomycetota bacterium]